MEPDFSGYATKAGLKCSDGRVITAEAFAHMDGKQVPLVWQHGHNDPSNVLGHAIFEARSDGIYARGFFNKTKQGLNAKDLVQHGDIKSLSIYANQLVEQSKRVLHGVIRELSLVLSGANPGAVIDWVQVVHGDGEVSVLTDEAVIRCDIDLEHGAIAETEEVEELEHAATDTVQDVYDTLNDEQKTVVHYLIGASLEAYKAENSVQQSAIGEETVEETLDHQEGNDDVTTKNVFEQNQVVPEEKHVLSHDAMKGIFADAIKIGSVREAVEAYALKHGIENIAVLFPDARTLQDRPEFNQRRTEWVSGVLDGTRHSPFSRVKTIVADITQDEARAKGYITGEYKKEEWFGVSKRTTSPTTVYKKQTLERDDVVDITDFDVVAWLKMEMRMMLEEEIARAILIGDGRDVSNEDKIKDPIGAADGVGIRSIVNDHELFVTTIMVNVDDANSDYDEVVDAVMDGMEFYKGTGTPDFYTTIKTLNKFLKAKDGMKRRLYKDKSEVAAALGVRSIVTVEPMNDEVDLIGVIVNLADYNIGADKGGEINLFDDFDIDYNKQKYLIETRLSGALTKIKSALVIKKTDVANVLVVPTEPTFVSATGVITIPTKTGVVYKNGAGTTLTAGAQTALTAGSSLTVVALAASGYYFANNAEDAWTFKRPVA